MNYYSKGTLSRNSHFLPFFNLIFSSIGFLLEKKAFFSSWFCFYTSFLIMTKKVLFCVFVEIKFWRMNMWSYLTETATVILLFNSKMFTAKLNFSLHIGAFKTLELELQLFLVLRKVFLLNYCEEPWLLKITFCFL